MKKIRLLYICLASALLSIGSYAKGTDLDKIVATVNDDVITTSELKQALTAANLQIAQEHAPPPSESALKKQVLEQLINKKLQLQIAELTGVQVSEDELDNTVNKIAEQNNLSVDELYQRLQQEGLSSTEYRSEMRDQITIHRLQQQEVAGKVKVSPQEIATFIKSKSWQTNSDKEYHLEDILIPLSDTPSPEEIAAAKKRADMVMTELHNGKSFSALAQSESGGSNALQGGDLGWRKLAEIPSAFADKIVHMRAKEVAGPIQTPNGFHIISLSAERSIGNQATPDRRQVEELLLQRKFEEAAQNWVSRLRSQAFISIKS